MTATTSPQWVQALSANEFDPTWGAKAINLWRLRHAGFNVPNGFVISGSAWLMAVAHLKTNAEALDDLSSKEHFSSPGSHAQQLRDLMTTVPECLHQCIKTHWQALNSTPVAVRSSSSIEDQAEFSFAGQHDSVLDVPDFEGILAAIVQVWRSLYSDRALSYLKQLGISPQYLSMAVLVQEMIVPELAGVLFTADPQSGDSEICSISMVNGQGEALVSGKERPIELQIVQDQIKGQRQNSLKNEQVLRLVSLGKEAEQCLNLGPLDIEWCFKDGDFFLLQARPMIGIPKEGVRWALPVPNSHWCRNWRLGEWLNAPVTPLFSSWALPILVKARETFGTGKLNLKHIQTFAMPSPWFCLVNGYFYTRQNLHQKSADMPLEQRLDRMRQLKQNLQHWLDVGLPQYLRKIHSYQQQDLSVLSPGALCDWLSHLLEEAGDLWYFSAPFGYGFEELVFKPIYEQHTSPVNRPHHSVFFRGYPNQSLYGQEKLFQIANNAEQTQNQLDQWCASYGHQVVSLDFYFPTMGELDQTNYLRSLKNAVSPVTLLSQVAQQREAESKRLFQNISSNRHDLFSELIDHFQAFAKAREDIFFYFQMIWPLLRKGLSVWSIQLIAKKILSSPEEIYFLNIEELQLSEKESRFLGTRANEREALWLKQKKLKAPEFLPVQSSHQQVAHPCGYLSESHSFQGQGVSQGKHRGQVCIISDMYHWPEVKQGAVLVVATASPALTPLMLNAGALVVDAGGGASHSSLIAREIGLPTVVNTCDASQRLSNSQWVEVDGSLGTVRILDVLSEKDSCSNLSLPER